MSEIVFLCADVAGEYSSGQCWEIVDSSAECISNPALSQKPLRLNDGQNLLQALASLPEGTNGRLHDIKKYVLRKCLSRRGCYFPRIFRNCLGMDEFASSSFFSNLNGREIVFAALMQTSILDKKLQEIFEFIYPSKDNMQAYSHEIRNLLILASTEVEAQLKGILKANSISPSRGGTYTTMDYVRLKGVLNLSDYSIQMWSYPWLGEVRPFEKWNAKESTKSLAWYDAYNAVKHDREGEFKRATLEHALSAVIACSVLIAAQFGKHSLVNQEYVFESRPRWKTEQVYVQPLAGIDWEPQNLELEENGAGGED